MDYETHRAVALIDLAAGCAATPTLCQFDLASKRLQGLTLLEWITRRLSEATLLDQVIITGHARYLPEIQASSLASARWMPSPHNDPVQRAFDIAQRTDADWLLFVPTTCPLIDAGLTDRMISSSWQNAGADYIGFVGGDHSDLGASQLGLSGQMCSVEAIEQLVDLQLTNSRDVPSAVTGNLHMLQMRLLPLPPPLATTEKKFSVHSSADVSRVESYLELDSEDLSWQRLLQLSEVSV